eukprot:1182230-Prorocentrum_minimum.AAC.2
MITSGKWGESTTSRVERFPSTPAVCSTSRRSSRHRKRLATNRRAESDTTNQSEVRERHHQPIRGQRATPPTNQRSESDTTNPSEVRERHHQPIGDQRATPPTNQRSESDNTNQSE